MHFSKIVNFSMIALFLNSVQVFAGQEVFSVYCQEEDSAFEQSLEVRDGYRLQLQRDGLTQTLVSDSVSERAGYIDLYVYKFKGADYECREYLSLANANDVELGAVSARVYFDFDSSALTPQSRAILAKISASLTQKDGVVLTGHTDNVGSQAYNNALGARRANAVKDYLSKVGMQNRDLNVRSKGESSPIASNDTSEGRQKNRRVEIQ